MEFEFDDDNGLSYDRNLVSDDPVRIYVPSPNATYYKPLNIRDNVSILPIEYLIIDDNVRIILNRLRNIFKTDKYYGDLGNSNIQNLKGKLRELFGDFKLNKAHKPIVVRSLVAINQPSVAYPTMPSVAGEGAPIVQYEILTDYLYQIIEGEAEIAMSLFFGYSHIPVVTRV